MSLYQNVQRIPLQITNDCIVGSIQIDITDDVLKQLQHDALNFIERSNASGIIFDVSGLSVIDRADFNALATIMDMAALMGVIPVLCGFRPGVVSSLVDLGADVDRVNAALDLDDAISFVKRQGLP